MASISAIQTMGHRDATKLRKAGVRTTDSLLKTASTRTGRRRLARKTDLAESDILSWANRADLLRITGVGSEYVDLLEVAGVDTIRELRRRNPDRLLAVMAELNLRRRLVRRLPTDGMVRDWIEEAGDLEPLVKH